MQKIGTKTLHFNTMCINTYQNLLDTIESLEKRIEKHTEILRKLSDIVRNYKDTGKSNSELSRIAQYVESLIQEAYK